MQTIKLSKQELDNIKLINNSVLVRPVVDTRKKRLGNTDITLEIDVDFDEDAHSRRVVEVVRTPNKLCFVKNTRSRVSMQWETEIEVLKGDIVWVRSLATIGNDQTNLTMFICEGDTYYLIKYQDFVVAKRGDEVICLNGYLLVHPNRDDYSEYKYVYVPESIKKDAAVETWIIKYSGNPNKNYRQGAKEDFSDELVLNQEVCLSKKRHPYPLENTLHSLFDGKEEYFFIQRADIVYIHEPVT